MIFPALVFFWSNQFVVWVALLLELILDLTPRYSWTLQIIYTVFGALALYSLLTLTLKLYLKKTNLKSVHWGHHVNILLGLLVLIILFIISINRNPNNIDYIELSILSIPFLLCALLYYLIYKDQFTAPKTP